MNWIDVKKLLPNRRESVLVFIRYDDEEIDKEPEYYEDNNGKIIYGHIEEAYWNLFPEVGNPENKVYIWIATDLEPIGLKVTHWMPFPEMPPR